MKKIYLFFSIIILLGIAAGVFVFYNKDYVQNALAPNKSANNIYITDKNITDNTKPFIIKITYPYIFGLENFNTKVEKIIDKEINDFKTNSLANDEAVKQVDPISYAKYPREYELDISYDKGQVNDDIVSAVFNVYNFEGGAHGASYFVPLNYSPKTKTEIKLANVFPNQPDYLQKISAFCIKDLTKQMTTSGAIDMSNSDWLNEGAGPKEENFQNFLINPSTSSGQATITFYFSQYQVAAGAAGDFKVTYPK